MRLDDFYVALIEENASRLVTDFYDVLRRNPEAHGYLDNQVVEDRLKPALVEWLHELFSPDAGGNAAAFEARQRCIGQVHARINVPMHLVNDGSSLLQAHIAQVIRESDQPWESRYDAMRMVCARINLAIAVMARSYVDGVEDRVRLEEVYRLFSLDQDLDLERERQRAGLMEWSQATLFGILQTSRDTPLQPLSGTPFGMWVRHRAGVLFDASPRLAALRRAINRIDIGLLPQLSSEDPASREDGLVSMRRSVDEMAVMLNELFQGLSDLESARDPLTRAMNRRFLASILSREIAYASKNGTGLAVMILDIDHFKQINDKHGHHVGDSILRDVSASVADSLRSTDFLFRYGGEEFLVVLVESDPGQSVAAAERVRQAIMGRTFTAGSAGVAVTVSIGLADHDGHPDPNHLVRRADGALYMAKEQGRNRLAVAP